MNPGRVFVPIHVHVLSLALLVLVNGFLMLLFGLATLDLTRSFQHQPHSNETVSDSGIGHPTGSTDRAKLLERLTQEARLNITEGILILVLACALLRIGYNLRQKRIRTDILAPD